MRTTIVSITDSEETSRALDVYFNTCMAATVESCFMTYRCSLLSGTLVRQADIFVMDMFSTDGTGPRAEGIFAAAKWLSLGKRALVISGAACADSIQDSLYWDLASEDKLTDRVLSILANPVPPPSALAPLRAHFGKYCRPAEDPHNRLDRAAFFQQ